MKIRILTYIITAHLFLAYLPATGASEQDRGFRFNRDRRSVTIPIKVRNNLAVIPLEINNRGPFYFILDTGVNTTILTEPIMAHLLGLEFSQSIFVYGLGGEGIVEAMLAENVTISMHGITGKNMNLIVIPENILSFSEVFGFPVYGVIGYDFLKNFPVEISYSSESMRVFREPTYRLRRRTETIPFRVIQGKPYVEATIVGTSGDSLTTHLLLDLGASHPIYLNRRYIGLSEETISGFLGKGISGNLMGQIGRVEKLIIGETEIEAPIVSYPDAEFLQFQGQSIHWEGIIGGGIIKRYHIILDYEREKMFIRRSPFYRQPFHTNLSGLEVVARGSNMRDFIIHYVRPGSVAYEAGLIAGDRIIYLDTESYRQITLDKILNALSQDEGAVIRMVVMRDDKLLNKRFRLREDL